ncbi:hypothetical protein GN958_ATG15272 [Phytophthora infestans]|uniref:RxLR effector protein n=1 Tax=Phytophthora infestans TaxID=4787 RepID=A0A8S9U7W9_PHYIN|nr:hypothetical protein GN958_ATG15272 [Phytophthora infestans]
MTNSNSPDTALHFNTENARAQGASLRALEEGVTDKAKAERGIFSSSSKLPASVSKEATEEMKKMWLKDSQLFDDMLVSNKKYYDALGVWKGLGYSEGKVSRAMAKLKKDASGRRRVVLLYSSKIFGLYLKELVLENCKPLRAFHRDFSFHFSSLFV